MAALSARAAELEGRLDGTAPGYLERVRRATARLAARPVGAGGDPRIALDDVEQAATIDLAVPTASAQRGGSLLKATIARLIGWYVRYVGQQVTVLGQAVTRFGTVMVERTDDLDARTDGLRRDLDGLAARVARLEQPRS
jgi:hypothetical protein